MSVRHFAFAALFVMGSTSLAHAHPHDTPDTKETAKKSWPYFGDDDAKTKDSSTKRIIIKRMVDGEDEAEMSADELGTKVKKRMRIHTRKLDEAGEKLSADTKSWTFKHEGEFKDAMSELETILEDSDMIEGLAALVTGFAEDFDVETTDDDVKVFKFDGETIGKMRLKTEKKGGVMISGLGQNLNIERETYMKNGKAKTRIVIEMDGGEDVDIDIDQAEGLKRVD